MKAIYLIRHAKSSWTDDSLTDFERPLNERGKKDAPRMAKRLKEKDIHPDLMITSPAKRASKTCKEFSKILKFPKTSIQNEKRLYHASPETILETIRGIRDKFDVVLLFGHNPGLTEFAEWITGETLNNIPTCGIVGVKLKTDSWKKTDPSLARMLFFDFPKRNLVKGE
ncbi:MAG: SixA phosphatase family protein [Cyclobacteriaceae bacterium]